MSKGGGTQTVTQKADPWKGAQPTLTGGLSDLSKWYSSGYGRNPYPGSTVVPFSPFSEQGFGMAANRAVSGSPINSSASNLMTKTLNGDFLSPDTNPWLSGTFDLAAGKVRSALDSQFNKGGLLGGSNHEGAMASNLNDLATQLYGGAYESERGRQAQGMLFAPTLANQDYYDADVLSKIGSQYEGKAQESLTDMQNRYDFYNQEPYQRLLQLFNIANPVAGQGGVTQTTSPTNSNGVSSTLGGLASGASLLGSLGILGSGAAAGAAGAGSAAALLPLLAASDRNSKVNIETLDDASIIRAFHSVPAYKYYYKMGAGDNGAEQRIGPMAQDMAAALGGDGKTIPMPQEIGLLHATIGALLRKVEELEKRIG